MHTQPLFLNDVLFVLDATRSFRWPDLAHANIQKMLYLSAALSPVVGIDWEYQFTSTAFGPFNKEIHEALDTLVRQRYAERISEPRQGDSSPRTRFRITSRGVLEVRRIGQLARERQRLDWITTIMGVLDIYGPVVVTKLAYEEPTLNQMRLQNRKGSIDLSPDENRSLGLLATIAAEFKQEYSIELDTVVSQLIAFFDYLSSGIGSSPDPHGAVA